LRAGASAGVKATAADGIRLPSGAETVPATEPLVDDWAEQMETRKNQARMQEKQKRDTGDLQGRDRG